MKNKDKFTLLLLLVIPFLLNAQVDEALLSNSCLTDQLHQKMLSEHPHYKSKHQKIEQKIYNLKNGASFTPKAVMTNHTIPVVVNIIHQNGAENISDAQVFDAIQQLNDAFANTGFYDPTTGVDVEIEFCLAMRDPQNNASNGINRIESALTNVTAETQDLDLKALLQWNPFDYLNIWVVNEITSQSAGPGVAGYAYFPAVHGLANDGIVIEASFMGSSPDSTKVLVHEAGHYLGLYHTFEGGCNNDNCQINGDRVCDTPPDQSTAPVDCGASINTCDTDEDDTSINNPFRAISLGGLGDQNDQYINYMDYGHLPCYSVFTQGQKERMTNALTTTRQSLLDSYGCQLPCPFDAFSASFTSSPSSPVLAGELINFTNTSDAANLYEWSINNQLIDNTLDLNYTFEEEGLFTVNLHIRDTTNFCKKSVEEVVEVICEGEAEFSASSTEISPGETVDFINMSTEHISYEWFLEGNSYSTEEDLSIVFTEPGFYSLYLVGTTASCSNFSSTTTIIVGTCEAEDKSEMHWYFGTNAALDFNSGEPVNVSGSQMALNEGSACISDDNGDLLFYTDGLSIWDATNTIMPNGTGLMGGANFSAWNQALVVPRPNNPDQYYVFTCDEFENAIANGIRYSIVDMNLNGGLGDVTDVKNVFLCSATSESMSAAYHNDGQKAWLVITDATVINSYLIDESGIGPTISYSNPNYDVDWGFTRFFNSGKRIILSENTLGPNLTIFDFDNTNGTFSNPVDINTSSFQFWSFEISPDDSKLYCSLADDATTFKLYQFDLSLTTGTQISNSKTFIGNLTLLDRLLLGPNGKIYSTVFNTSFLGAIENPNELGMDCNYDYINVYLSPASNILSLPKFIRGQRGNSGLSIPIVNLGADQSICEGLTSVLNPGNDDYEFLWQDGSTDSTFTAWLPGTYQVTATNECGSVTDSINIELEELGLVNLGPDVSLCEENITLNAGTQGDFYLWQDGTNTSTLEVSEPGVYWVNVSTQAGCFQRDTVNVTLDTQSPMIDCPPNLDTLISFDTSEVLLSPNLPSVIDDCGYTLVNNFTNTDNASANYPAGSTTTVTWTATDINGNSSSCNMDVTVDISTGTTFLDNEKESLMLYPNPSNGLFILEKTYNNSTEIQLSIFNTLGRQIYEQSAILRDKILIDLTKQATGVYFLQWSIGEDSGVFKLIKN